MKLGRIYTLKLQVGALGEVGSQINVEYPATLEFEVSRNTLASANTGRFTIYNLSEGTRRKIFHDRYDTLNYRQIVLQAGYEGDRPLPIIFQGNVVSAYSSRNRTEFLTEIDAFDGGYGIINSQVQTTVPAGAQSKEVIRRVIQTLGHVNLGSVGNFDVENTRGQTLMGNSWDVVNRLAGDGTAFIDNEKANVLKKNEYLARADGIALISSETGMLGTPRRYDARIEVEMVFEPRVVIGQLVRLQSLESVNNGLYQIIGISHKGTISGAVDRGVITNLSLWAGTEKLTGVN